MTDSNSHPVSMAGRRSRPIDWPAVLHEHGRWLRTVVYARAGSADAVEEILQDVALAAVRQEQPPPPDRLAAWLYSVAVRSAVLYRRRIGREKRRNANFARLQSGQRNGAGAPDPLDWLLNAERDELIRQAVSQLAPRDTEILLLKYTEDWTYRQLAGHLGVSESALEARLHRARARLRVRLVALNVIGEAP